MSVFVFVLVMSLFCCSCDADVGLSSQARTQVDIVTWNVQTFFDATTEGTEYSDFKNHKYWNEKKYIERLNRLCLVLKTLNADVYVLQEIENESVLIDISNVLAGNAWRAKDNWKFSCFAKEEGSSIGCAILSKIPLTKVRTHSLDVRNENETQPSLRLMIQASLQVGESELVIFANHWKSKSGDVEKSKVWRNWQESLLAYSLMNIEPVERVGVVACGDFNRDVTEFLIDNNQDGNILLRCVENGENKTIRVFSPWLDKNGEIAYEIGSYYFKENWNRIDNFFFYGDVKVFDFEPVSMEPWATPNKTPIPYRTYTGEGFSDHLPLRCRVLF